MILTIRNDSIVDDSAVSLEDEKSGLIFSNNGECLWYRFGLKFVHESHLLSYQLMIRLSVERSC